MQDDERLREERRKARRSKEKYVGMSSDEAPFYQNSVSRRVSGMPSSTSNRESSMSTTTRRDDQDDTYSDRYEWKDDTGSIAEPADYHHRDAGNENAAGSKRSSDIGGDSTPPRTTTPAAVSGVIPQSKQQPASSHAFDLLGDLSGGVSSPTPTFTNTGGNASLINEFNPFQSSTASAVNTNLFEHQQASAGFVPDFNSAFSSVAQPPLASVQPSNSMSLSFADFEQPKVNPR